MKRKFLIWALLSLVPFTGFRVACVSTPGPTPSARVDPAPADECATLCTLRAPVRGGTRCALHPDDTTVVLIAGIALMPASVALRVPVAVAVVECSDPPHWYLDPGLDRHSPPPKA